MKPSVIILAFNSVDTIGATLAQAREISDDIYVVDSFSTDDTVALCREQGAQVVQHAFENYGVQRNWAIDNVVLRYPWQLHLDADERLTPELIASVRALPEDPPEPGFLVARLVEFLGRQLRHGGMSPTWHLRLFRNGAGRCEERKYDQHFYLLEGSAARLQGYMIDEIRMSLSEWTARHNRWSDAEVLEQTAPPGGMRVQPRLMGNPLERKRFLRGLYNGAPLFIRPFVLFFYRYFVRLGFLDGREGFIFWTLQTFWFRFLIDAKIFERGKNKRSLR
ncbi:MAG: glycosyltransferase family 2 protein [Acidobacteriaceae bacterium]